VFLNEVNEKTGLDCEIIHARAEDGGKNQALREKFDFACARAVAPLNVLLEYCTPFVKVGGMFVAMKGPAAEEEIKAARNAEKLLNVKLDNKTHLTLEGNDERFIVSYKKISQTPPKFPRISGKISKTPL
jgi:16S rRNA (guanine527-N7)-methyltransferase